MTQSRSLTLLQMNDSHAYFDLHPEIFWEAGGAAYRPAGGYARIATLVKQIRAQATGPVLFCDGGDTLHGTFPAVETQGRALVPILNALGLDAMTAHWDFAYSPQTLQERVAELSYPLLAINVYDRQTKKLVFSPYLIKEIEGLRVGIIGIASNIVDKTMPPRFSEGVYFTLGKDELPGAITQLREQEQVDLVVLLSHLGFPQDMQLVSEVPGVDVCLSSHTHNRLYRAVKQGNTLVIQSGSQGAFLGRLDLEIEDGHIKDYRHQLIEVSASIAPDSTVADLVEQALALNRGMLSEVVGETATGLHRHMTLEATMDNFLLQALQASTGAQLAFSNGWRYGAPIPPGPIMLNELYNVIPMNPPVSTVQLRGEEIWAMLEENLERTFARNPYEQMGGYIKRCLGLRAYIRIENPPGHRIQKLYVGESEVSPKETYGAVFVTEQGVPRKYGHKREERTEHAVEAMRSYLAQHRRIQTELQGTFTLI
ncbi:MAG: 5'-nucleotidase C-terminal domain-containing protein [Chloroflexi bacterium]|nr:5'-nucleotidase C-terminal domain-containing protein [Chloroflexota bacterium]